MAKTETHIQKINLVPLNGNVPDYIKVWLEKRATAAYGSMNQQLNLILEKEYKNDTGNHKNKTA